jgi:O-antigen/teichoic acid export membrane protein
MTGRPGVNFANSVVAVGLYAAGGAIFVPRFGLVAMAWVDVVVTAAVNLARVIEAKLLVGVQPFGRSSLKPLGATAAGIVALLMWKLVPAASLWVDAVGIAFGALVYLAVLRAMGLDPEERHVWDRIKQRVLRSRPGGRGA